MKCFRRVNRHRRIISDRLPEGDGIHAFSGLKLQFGVRVKSAPQFSIKAFGRGQTLPAPQTGGSVKWWLVLERPLSMV